MSRPCGVRWVCQISCPGRQDPIVEATRLSDRHLTAGTRLGRYEIRSTLGAGGMGVVYEARDGIAGRDVALKVLPGMDADSLHSFKRGFRAGADLEHTNLVRLHELLTVDGAWAYSMELVRGTSLRAALEEPGLMPGSPAYFERVRALFVQLARALSALHRARLLHLDVKPANVLVEKMTGRVVLLDFGLAAAREPVGLGRRLTVAGTPEYLAPETARGEAPLPASDVYALGVVLFETLTGSLPIRGTSAREILLNKIDCDPPRASELCSDTPLDLDLLAARLLHRSPRSRPTLDEIEKLLGKPASPRPTALRNSIGPTHRFGELTSLGEGLSRMARGEPQAVVLQGPIGSGKRALIETFTDWARAQPRTLVLTARCHPRETMPFRALDPIIDAITDHLCRMPPGLVATWIPPGIRSAVGLFPVLLRVEAIRRALVTEPIDDGPVVSPFEAIEALIRELSATCRLVIVLEDLEWGDEASARLVGELLSGEDAVPLLFVGTCSTEGGPSPFLRVLEQRAPEGRRRCVSL